MEKSNKYTGVKYFIGQDKNYWKDNAFIVLKVNFDDKGFEDWYLDRILKSEYQSYEDVPSFKNFDEKVDHCLDIISKQIFEWIKHYYVFDDYENENAACFVNERYYDEFIVLSVENTEHTPIYLSYHECNYNNFIPEADIDMQLLTDKDIMNEKWK